MPIHLVPQHENTYQRAQFTTVTLSRENSTHILWNRKIVWNVTTQIHFNKSKCRAQKTWHIVQTKQISHYVQHWKNTRILHSTLRNKWKRKDVDRLQRKLVMMGVLTQNCINFCSNEEWKYFHADMPIMSKNDMEKVSRNNCSTLLVTSSWNVYECMWLMVICHCQHLSKEEKANIQHFYHHILYCQKKTEF